MILIALSIFINFVFSTDHQPTHHLCNFVGFPADVLDHIASYLPYSNNVYETSEVFLERLKKAESLEESMQNCRKQISQDKYGYTWVVDCIPVFWSKKYKFEPFKADRILPYFVLSTTHNYMATLGLYSSISIEGKTSFPLSRHEIQVFKLCNSQYNALWSSPANSSYVDAVHGVAVSNCGQVAIVKNPMGSKSVSLIDEEKIELKYQTSLKYNSNNYLCWAIKIVGLLFNNQASKLGIKIHFLYDALIDETHVNESNFRAILKKWFSRNYKKKYKSIMSHECYQNIIELFDKPINTHKIFWDTLKAIINDPKAYQIISKDIYDGNDELCPIKIIPFNNHTDLWSLEKYFQLRGVCKNFHMQCGITKLSNPN